MKYQIFLKSNILALQVATSFVLSSHESEIFVSKLHHLSVVLEDALTFQICDYVINLPTSQVFSMNCSCRTLPSLTYSHNSKIDPIRFSTHSYSQKESKKKIFATIWTLQEQSEQAPRTFTLQTHSSMRFSLCIVTAARNSHLHCWLTFLFQKKLLQTSSGHSTKGMH